MGKSNNCFLIKFFILFCLVCVVLCAHQKHHKRDVHRIILKERPSRSHKNTGHHGHSHSRKKGHKNKGKKTSDESNSSSFEDSGSFSTENNSFEDGFHGHKPHTKQSHAKKPSTRHRFPSNLDIEETRQYPFREELTPFYNSDWIPLNGHSSDHLHLPSEHHHTTIADPHREKERRNPRKTKKRSHKPNNKVKKPFGVDFTTSYPSMSYESSTLYPPIDVISSFNALNHKFIRNIPSIVSTLEQSTLKNTPDKLKNHKQSYDVRENQSSAPEEYILVQDKPDFGSLEYVGKFENKDMGHATKNEKVRDLFRQCGHINQIIQCVRLNKSLQKKKKYTVFDMSQL